MNYSIKNLCSPFAYRSFIIYSLRARNNSIQLTTTGNVIPCRWDSHPNCNSLHQPASVLSPRWKGKANNEDKCGIIGNVPLSSNHIEPIDCCGWHPDGSLMIFIIQNDCPPNTIERPRLSIANRIWNYVARDIRLQVIFDGEYNAKMEWTDRRCKPIIYVHCTIHYYCNSGSNSKNNFQITSLLWTWYGHCYALTGRLWTIGHHFSSSKGERRERM